MKTPAEMKVRQDILDIEALRWLGVWLVFFPGWCRLDTMPFAWLVADWFLANQIGERFKLLLFFLEIQIDLSLTCASRHFTRWAISDT